MSLGGRSSEWEGQVGNSRRPIHSPDGSPLLWLCFRPLPSLQLNLQSLCKRCSDGGRKVAVGAMFAVVAPRLSTLTLGAPTVVSLPFLRSQEVAPHAPRVALRFTDAHVCSLFPQLFPQRREAPSAPNSEFGPQPWRMWRCHSPAAIGIRPAHFRPKAVVLPR